MNFEFLGVVCLFFSVFLVPRWIFFFGESGGFSPRHPSGNPNRPCAWRTNGWPNPQRRLEKLIEDSEQPLSAAQTELLELRLSAGRLPQGVKELNLVREGLRRSSTPSSKNLRDLLRSLLPKGGWREENKSLFLLKTPLGDVPILESGDGEGPPSDHSMKSLLSQAHLIFEKGKHPTSLWVVLFIFKRITITASVNQGWMRGLKTQRWMIMDRGGLKALLVSLRMTADVDKILDVLKKG